MVKYAAYAANPEAFVTYGPDANCTLELCPIETSLFQYRPSIAANTVFLVLFAIALLIHILLGVKWRTWVFGSVMALGCLTEVIGYVGRILMWQDPFSFTGFMMQICELHIIQMLVWESMLIKPRLHHTRTYVLYRSDLLNTVQNVCIHHPGT